MKTTFFSGVVEFVIKNIVLLKSKVKQIVSNIKLDDIKMNIILN